jgi:hypothetical protein
MNIWRMKLRDGKGGHDMWPACRARGIASFTHQPILNTDLTNLQKADVDPNVKGSARPSIWYFAWEIKGGDVIYVGDSKTQQLVGRGIVSGNLGSRAYRYNAGNAIAPPAPPTTPWRHEVPVEWETNFKSIPYKDPAPQNSVFPFRIPALERQMDSGKADDHGTRDLLNELAFQRETPASKRTIAGLHRSLSNDFRRWLEREFELKVVQEKNRIDLTFKLASRKHLAELKICYGGDTRHAIREALGQLLEYNHYQSYDEADFWWLILDCEPSKADRKFIAVLIEKYRIPLTIAWTKGNEFLTFPSSPLAG